MKALKVIAVVASLFSPMLATATESVVNGFKPSSEGLYVATAGEVLVTFISKSAAYTDELFLKGGTGSILDNQTASLGNQYSLGTFDAGTLLTFGINVNDTGDKFYSGLASQNMDNFAHAAYESVSKNTIMVGFEDLFNGGDQDYNDLVFLVSNVNVGLVSSVPEPSNHAMILSGLGLLALARRCTQK
jgi:hypothetical protein